MNKVNSNLGRSGCRILIDGDTVHKHGTTENDVFQEANLCSLLGKKVCPVIRSNHITGAGSISSYYVMEKLDDIPHIDYNNLIEEAYKKLSRFVWYRQAPTYYTSWVDHTARKIEEIHRRWKIPDWVNMDKALWRLYLNNGEVKPCLIHGDPTIANMMYRNGQLIFIDPVKCREDVPPLKEVDMAALVQSIYGWEPAIDKQGMEKGRYDTLMSSHIRTLEGLIFMHSEPLEIARTYFWMAYKCLRILRKNNSEETVKWAKSHYAHFTGKTWEVIYSASL